MHRWLTCWWTSYLWQAPIFCCLKKAADAVASLTMTTIATPDAMPLAMAQPAAQEVRVSTRKRRPAISKARSGLASRKRNREALGFDEQLKQDVARLAKLARWSKRREDAPAVQK